MDPDKDRMPAPSATSATTSLTGVSRFFSSFFGSSSRQAVENDAPPPTNPLSSPSSGQPSEQLFPTEESPNSVDGDENIRSRQQVILEGNSAANLHPNFNAEEADDGKELDRAMRKSEVVTLHDFNRIKVLQNAN